MKANQYATAPLTSVSKPTGDGSNATSLSTSKSRRSNMKKTVRIIALPVLAAAVALLSACTTTLPKSDATSAASGAKFDQLSQRLDELSQRLDKVVPKNQEANEDDSEKRYQELRFTFANLEAAGKRQKNIIYELDKFLAKENKFKKSIQPKGVNRQYKITYVKTEPWGITEEEKEKIENRVKGFANKWTGEIQAHAFKMPVATNSKEFKLRFLKETHAYNVTSGSAIAVTVLRKCKLTYTITLDPELISRGTAHVYNPDPNGGRGTLDKSGGEIPFSVDGIRKGDGCEPDPKQQDLQYRYIMVVSTDKPEVAQYYKATFCTSGKQGRCNKVDYVSGRITEGGPACPPKDWDNENYANDMREQMEKKLEGNCISS